MQRLPHPLWWSTDHAREDRQLYTDLRHHGHSRRDLEIVAGVIGEALDLTEDAEILIYDSDYAPPVASMTIRVKVVYTPGDLVRR